MLIQKSSSPSSTNTPNETTTTTATIDWKRNAICSQTAASISAVLFNPLEVIKLRLMSQDGSSLRTHNHGVQYRSAWHAFKEMRGGNNKNVNDWRIFFRGAHVGAFAGGLSHGIYMATYKFCSNEMMKSHNNNNNHNNNGITCLPFHETFACSILGNVAVALGTNPFWFIKTRMQIHDETTTAIQQNKKSFRSAITCFKSTLEKEKSILVLWRGTSAQLLLSLPSSLHFPLYEFLKKKTNGYFSSNNEQHQNNNSSSRTFFSIFFVSHVVFCNLLAKTFVALLGHPLILIRTRLQDERARRKTSSPINRANNANVYYYHNIRDTAIGCYKQQGLRGFWRGLGPSLMQVVPRSIVHVFLYETLLKSMNW